MAIIKEKRMPRTSVAAKQKDEELPDVSKMPVDNSTAYGRIIECIKKPPEHSVVLTITPEDATNILARHNTKNRPVKPSAIRDYVRDISTNNWAVTGDTIKFAPSGRLLDGQNRLTACVQADKSIKTHVVFGIDEDYFRVLDVGRTRTPGDILHIAGYTDVNRLASAIRNALILDGAYESKQTRQFRPETLLKAIQNEYSDLLDYMSDAVALYKATTYPPGMAAALLRKMHRIDKKDAQEFYNAWRFGYAEGRADSVRKMLEYLNQLNIQLPGGIPARTRIIVTITAWNCFRENKRGTQATFRRALEKREGYPSLGEEAQGK
jgi:hypothetical protein